MDSQEMSEVASSSGSLRKFLHFPAKTKKQWMSLVWIKRAGERTGKTSSLHIGSASRPKHFR